MSYAFVPTLRALGYKWVVVQTTLYAPLGLFRVVIKTVLPSFSAYSSKYIALYAKPAFGNNFGPLKVP